MTKKGRDKRIQARLNKATYIILLSMPLNLFHYV